MFPIPWNFPFRKKNGDVTTLDAVISSGGGGYELPTASEETKGGVKIGAGLSMDGDVLNNTNPTPPTPYSLPTASSVTLGGVKVGSSLTINNGVLNDGWEDITNNITFDTNATLKEGALYKKGDLVLCSLRVKIDTDSALKDGGTILTLPENARPSRAFLVSGIVQCLETQGGSTYTSIGGVVFIRNTGAVEAYKYGETYALDTVWIDYVFTLNHNIE